MSHRHIRLLVTGVATLAFAIASAQAQPQTIKDQTGVKVQGHVVQIKGSDQLIVRTMDNKDLVFITNPKTTFLLRKQAVLFTDVREGVPVDIVYDVKGNQNMAGSFTLTPTEVVEGEVVRVVEKDNQLILRNKDSKEVVVIIDPRTNITLENRAARLVDFRPGTMVRVHYDVRDNRNVAYSLWTMTIKK
jgi:hypothetical protein